MPGPPYVPQVAQLGGLPTPAVDDPISAVLLLLFAGAAATNMTIFQINRRRDHKFVFSALLFGFCMARIAALSMRMAWASHPTNVNVAIAANVFTVAGVILLFLVNLLFTARLVRAYHPHFGWHPATRWAFRLVYFSLVADLVMAVVASVQAFFTLDPNTRRIDRDIQLFVTTSFAVLAFLPVPVVALAAALPRPSRLEKFGQGRFRTKRRLLLGTALLLTLGAAFRTGVAFDVRPAAQPAWFHHRAAYYCFNYVVELLVVYAYTVARFDRRFHVPDGSSGPGHYAGGRQGKDAGLADRVNAEADVFGSDAPPDAAGGTGLVGRSESIPRLTREWEEKAQDELEKEAV